MCSDSTETKNLSALDRDVVSEKHQVLRTEFIASTELLGASGLAHPEDSMTTQLQVSVAVRRNGAFR